MIARIIIIAALTGLICCSLCPASETVKVRTASGTEKIDAFRESGNYYFSLSHLNRILGGSLEWVEPGYSVRYAVDTSVFLFAANSPYVNFDDSVCNLILPVRISRGTLYVPAATFTPLLDLSRPESISWDEDNATLRIDAEWFHVTDLAVTAKTNGLLIELFMASPLPFEIYESEGNWINLNFPDARINRNKILSGYSRQNIIKVNAFQFENSAQVSFQLRRPFKKYYHTFKANPGRLQIAVEDAQFNPDSMITDIKTIGPDEKIDVIVIDPGHGGNDYGAIGRSRGTREKEINLDIARRLAKLIRKDKQLKVVLTRNDDVSVTLDQRAKTANDAKADLFISIHCNSSPRTQAGGHQVFYLAPAKNDSARAVAQNENAPFLLDDPSVAGDGQDDLAFILHDMIQTEFLTESADLAYMADIELRKKLPLRARGVDHAAFFVLNRVYMPSILLESAFISNQEEENLLRKKNFRQDLAEAIYESIKRFKAKYERI